MPFFRWLRRGLRFGGFWSPDPPCGRSGVATITRTRRVENKLGGGASDSELFRSGAAGAPNIPESARAARAWRDSAESSLPAGTGSESDFHVSPERRAIIFPVSRKEQNNDLRDLLISQQVRRIDELERQVDMLEALLHGRRRKEQAANTLPEEQTDTAADKSPDTDGQQQ